MRIISRKTTGLAAVAISTGLLSSCLVGCTTDQLDRGLEKLREERSAASAANSPAPTPSRVSQFDAESPTPTLGGMQAPSSHMPSAWREAVDHAENNFGGQMGIAVAVPGAGAQAYGSLLSTVAWSTSKVPIAVAVVREQGVTPEVNAAITASDNPAAEAMWLSLGAAEAAGQKVNQVLRDAGDMHTNIHTERIRPEFSAFGQTQWTLENQAKFAAQLRCIAGGAEVVDLMSQVVAAQAYGLGEIEGAAFKGGWGPDEAGSYTTRQLGVVPGGEPGSFVGIAIAAKSADGSYETEQAMLSAVAQAVATHPMVGGSC